MATRSEVVEMLGRMDPGVGRMIVDGRQGNQFESLCDGLSASEDLLALVAGEDMSHGSGFFGAIEGSGLLIVTSRRVGALIKKGPRWDLLTDVSSAESTFTQNGIRLMVGGRFLGFKIELRRITSTHTKFDILQFLKTAGRVNSLTENGPVDRSQAPVATTRGTFLGGRFIGNVRRGVDLTFPLGPIRDHLDMRLTLRADDVLDIGERVGQSAVPVARFPVTSPVLAFERQEQAGRVVSVGWLAAAAAGTAVLGPAALAGVAMAAKPSTSEAYVLVVADGDDVGAFLWTDGAVVRRVLARRLELGVPSDAYEKF